MTRYPDPELGPFLDTKWTVLEVGLRNAYNHHTVRVQCECGTESIVQTRELLLGKTTQCRGCHNRAVGPRGLAIARASISSERKREIGRSGGNASHPGGHRMSSHPLFRVWVNMMARCYNPRHDSFPRYGARQPYPITVCPRWHDARVFIEDIERLLGPCPPGYSFDRIRNGLGYKPSNVRWADDHIQMENRGKSWWEMSIAEQLARTDLWKQELVGCGG